MILFSHSGGIFPKWVISSIKSLSPFNSRGFQYFSCNQGCTSSLVTFHQLGHNFKWDMCVCVLGGGGGGFHGIDFHEGIWVQLYIQEALIVFYAASSALPSRHNTPASLRTGFSNWTSSFCISFGWWSVLPAERFLRTSCLAWDYAW